MHNSLLVELRTDLTGSVGCPGLAMQISSLDHSVDLRIHEESHTPGRLA